MFPLWTFHLYVVTFQLHLHMEYISLSWYDIPEHVVLIGWVEVITSKTLRSPLWLGWPQCNVCVTNHHSYVPFVVNTSRYFPPWLITGFVTGATSKAGTTYPSGAPEFTHGSCYSIFSFMCMFCRSLFVLLAIVLSVLLRFTDSGLPLWHLQTLLTTILQLIVVSMMNIFLNIFALSSYGLRVILDFRYINRTLNGLQMRV